MGTSKHPLLRVDPFQVGNGHRGFSGATEAFVPFPPGNEKDFDHAALSELRALSAGERWGRQCTADCR